MQKYLGIIILSVIVILIFLTVILSKKKQENARLISTVKEKWARDPLRDSKPNINSNTHYYYTNITSGENAKKNCIDDITWNDLDMDNVFQRINNTLSTVGEQYLYFLLRNPIYDKTVLQERERLLSFFQANRKKRLDIQLLLSKLGKTKTIDITDYFINETKDTSITNVNYKLLSISLILSPLLLFFDVSLAVLVIVGLLFTNITLYYKKKYEIDAHLEAFNYIVNLVNCADKISNLDIKEISQYGKSLKSSLKKIKGVISKSFLVIYQTENPLLEYVKVVFLGEIIAYQSMFKLILKYKADLMDIFNTIGSIDSLISIASYRASLEHYTRPQLDHSNLDKHYISFEKIYHPLIKKPVDNSLNINKALLITGSNASGKSTFLKTVALNAIFAQTINTCLAEKYSSSYFAIFTSMALRDNLKGGESYYIAEIKSLKRIIDSLNSDIPCLCFIDEVLRGTNTIERVAASSELLFYLSTGNCMPIAATHDLELGRILAKHFVNYHFQEYVTDNDIVFDYKIYPELSNSRNAIKLLGLMGYSQDIVESSEARAQEFIKEGKWFEI